jgi:endonuclease/exonuclease/phosphatase (EEP) superfamily protein YafD
MKPPAPPSIEGLVSAGATLAAVATVAGFLAPLGWILELATHFRVQYLAVLAIAAVVLAFRRQRGPAIVFATLAIANLLVVAPLWISAGTATAATGASVRVMLMNVFAENTDTRAVLDAVARHDPTVVLMQETNARWIEELRPLAIAYPYSVQQPRADNFGIALFSKLPFEASRVVYFEDEDVPSVFASLRVGARTVSILGVHALPPVSAEYAANRNAHLAGIAAFARRAEPPLLVIGDFNTTPFSPVYRRLVRDSGLHDARIGRGLNATWPTQFPPLLIPIDHCLYSDGLSPSAWQLGEYVGSDHYPVIVDVDVLPG